MSKITLRNLTVNEEEAFLAANNADWSEFDFAHHYQGEATEKL